LHQRAHGDGPARFLQQRDAREQLADQPAFPYQGATASACANADLCWKRADASATVYIALQNVRDQNSAVYFTARQVTVK
jgi:hypothetical protein